MNKLFLGIFFFALSSSAMETVTLEDEAAWLAQGTGKQGFLDQNIVASIAHALSKIRKEYSELKEYNAELCFNLAIVKKNNDKSIRNILATYPHASLQVTEMFYNVRVQNIVDIPSLIEIFKKNSIDVFLDDNLCSAHKTNITLTMEENPWCFTFIKYKGSRFLGNYVTETKEIFYNNNNQKIIFSRHT